MDATPTKHFAFDLIATDGMARRGRIATPRGEIETPAFMPVGTAGTVKAMYPEQVRETGADILLGNTYHLMLRPGAERVASLGGLHDFMDWAAADPHRLRRLSGDVAGQAQEARPSRASPSAATSTARAYELTPERSIEIQTLLDSDIIMQLDECIALPAPREEMERAMELSLRWGAAHRRPPSATSRTGRCSASCRAATIPSCVPARPRASASIGFDGYCGRRPRGRRAAGDDVPRARRDHARAAARTGRAT